MKNFFSEKTSDSFHTFSDEHFFALAIIVLIIVMVISFRHTLRRELYNQLFRYGLFFSLFTFELTLHIWLINTGEWSIAYSLPLHLSSLSLILSLFLLITKNKFAFYFVYFAGIASGVQALLTPDLGYGFPHFRFLHFFIGHGGIVVTALFYVFVERYYVTLKSLVGTFLALNVIATIVFALNFKLGGNYMFLARKPLNPSILNLLPPWPYYIIHLEVLALVSFFLLYLPFIKK